MSNLDNFKTLLNKPQKDYSVLSFSDMAIYPIIHFPSCPNLRHPPLDDLHLSSKMIKEASEARIRLDHIDEEILINNDKLITNLQLDQVDVEDVNWEKLKTEMSAIPRLTNPPKSKIIKNKSPLRISKIKPSKSLEASPLRLNKKLTPVRLKKPNQNIKIKNINKFINKPHQRNPPTIKQNNNFSKTQLLKKPTINHSRSTSVSTPNNRTMIRTKNNSVEKKVRPFGKTQRGGKGIIRFGPNALKNIDKTIVDLQSMFGQKMDNVEAVYQNMGENDIKNILSTLLGLVNELKTEVKSEKSKADTMKKELDSKNKLINNANKEITKLKEQIKKKEIANNNIQKVSYSKHNRAISLAASSGMKKCKDSEENLKIPLNNKRMKK